MPKPAWEPVSGSTPTHGWRTRTNSSSARKKKIPNLNRRKKTILGKNTSDNSELLRPGAQVWRREPKPFLFPSFQNSRVRCRWTIGWRLVPWPPIGVCSGRLAQIANCCHSQEEGGGQGIMTQVFVGWYSLQGCFLSRSALRLLWSSTEHLILTEAIGAAPCPVLLPSYTFPITCGHAGMTQMLRVTHSMLQPLPCTTAWISCCCLLVTLLKLHLRKIKQNLKIAQKSFVKSVMSWLLEHFSRVCGCNVQQVVPVMLKTFDIVPSGRFSGSFLLKIGFFQNGEWDRLCS